MKLATIAKYVDQPMILNKLDNKMPKLLILAGGTLGVADSIKTAKKDKKMPRRSLYKMLLLFQVQLEHLYSVLEDLKSAIKKFLTD